MLRPRPILLLTALALLGGSAVMAGVLSVTPGPDIKPPDADYFYLRAPIDCSTPEAVLDLAPGTVDTLFGDTTGGTSQIPSYPCAPWNEPGPEHIYQLELAEDLELTAMFVDPADTVDLDLFLLDACDTDACLIGVNTEFTALLEAGTYYLIIDGAGAGPAEDFGPYTVALEMRYPGVPPEVCDPTYHTVVTCAASAQIFDDNLLGKPDWVRSYDCAGTLQAGGESWFEVTVPDSNTLYVQVTTDTLSLDPSLWLFESCGADAACLDFVNAETGGQPESLEWLNETGAEATVYLGVDCFRAPEVEEGGNIAVEIRCDLLVDTEKTSLGSFKSLFR